MSFCNREVFEFCEREVAFRCLLPAFRVLSSSVLRFCNHEFAFGYYLAAFQSRVRDLLAACQGFATTKSRYAIFSYSSLSNPGFQTRSSHLWAAFQGDYFAVQWFIWIQNHSTALNKIILYKIRFVRHKSATGSTDSIQLKQVGAPTIF